MNYESDDDKPLIPPPAYDSDDEPLMLYSTPKEYDSDDEPLIKSVGRPKKKIIHMTEAEFRAEMEMEDGYDSDDEPLMRYSTPKEYDSDDDKPLMPPPSAFAPVHQYTTINIRANDDTDDVNYHYILIERRQSRKRRWKMIKKSCRRKRTASEKWRDMRAVINISKRKDKQDRVKVIMGKYDFKIKAYYNMNKKNLECEVARALWK